ncbi:hypothetical protein CYR40_07530 [Chimaeribacter arupi]|uniref:OmpR/PhoB-type domain-containing protein n=2 Tax=Yersiniaceae TaxID=1903411 RepID=A0A2N5ERT0_9GAMM|nr:MULTISPECIES: winged helix-turn-helix domain-containing protein [Yersiniaceae]MBS0968796.1 winged helix-turn-helix domain-containing protein [Nissabacter archeti]MDV5138733.1 winged helix-turn-helix domain-containing protein [Chimaeribacter arupi]PLR34144.1 hypothetical protein CYR23_10720 [Chimaeribacter arupi]PLR47932.1 hypothetical protein CYR40_07530 [Chimaeribacter arupi]PLR52561.1 hypothetical protein CYR34_03360 [Chimaeribacter arupi]
MMSNYLLNKMCIFNENAKELKLVDSDVIIKLTSMRARCLSYIIEHANEDVIEKSSLSQALWGKRSQFASDASLTQTLYLIRKDLKTLGLDDFFITVPRSGIRVNDTVQIEKLEKAPEIVYPRKGLYLTGGALILFLIAVGTLFFLY